MTENILKTLAYFDVLDYPLVLQEVFKFLWNKKLLKISLEDVKFELENLIKKNKVEEKDGFYFLKNRADIVGLRKKREKISLAKIKKAQRMVKLLSCLPCIKAVFICSSLGLLNAKNEADIDFLIITQKNRIWTARFWSAGFLKLFGLRPNKKITKDKFCLSHFMTEDNLSLIKTKIFKDDVHLIYLLTYYLPVYVEEDLWYKFIGANLWIKNYVPNFNYSQEQEEFIIKNRLVWLKQILRKIMFKGCEKIFKKIELWYLPLILKKMMNQDKRVIMNDKMLKLHTNDEREKIYKKWRNKIRDL